jgi:hypothetical protein
MSKINKKRGGEERGEEKWILPNFDKKEDAGRGGEGGDGDRAGGDGDFGGVEGGLERGDIGERGDAARGCEILPQQYQIK